MGQNNNINKKNSLDYTLDDLSNDLLKNMDINTLKSEINRISNAINDDELDLSPDEKIELERDLELISELISTKLNENRSNSSEFSNESLIVVGSDSVDIEEDVVVGSDSVDIEEDVVVGSDSVDIEEDVVVGSDSVDIEINDLTISDNNSKQLKVLPLEDDENVLPKSSTSNDNNGSDDLDVGSVDDALNELVEDYSDDYAIKVEHVSMDFKISKDRIDSLKEYIIRTIKRNKEGYNIFTALDDVSFQIKKGDRYGIIGFNGAGKSTLLKLLARVYDPTAGKIITKGKIAPLLELGAGFDPNYTGRDNVFLNGAFLGYPEEFLKEKFDEILEFSELGEAIDYHVKTYSSGMRAKLGFSIATIVEPDILIIDEILSVGDIKFRRKSADKMRSLINSGVTVLLVSHSVSQIRDLCNKAIWIDEGKIRMMGEVNKVCDAYVKAADDATKEQVQNLNFD